MLHTTCPRCSSNQTQSVPTAVAQGTSSFSGAAMGFEFGSGDVGVAGFGGTSQTAFAAAVSHRHRPTLPLAGGAAMIIVATIATAWAGSTLPDLAAWPVALAAWALVPVTVVWLKARRKKWDADMAVWARSWVCRACGSVWDASAEKAA